MDERGNERRHLCHLRTFDNSKCVGTGYFIKQKECEPEERIKILLEVNGGSLCNIGTYGINDDNGGYPTIEAVLKTIRHKHTHLLEHTDVS
ncbi:hypothetical protein [Alteribacter populi]|uniref:hypothetical protein n=1 Tax=Alteribacter populi TaxID=2011011 RepID=UPI0012FE4801|nr:hypothetical protein [Alteribacter populi]